MQVCQVLLCQLCWILGSFRMRTMQPIFVLAFFDSRLCLSVKDFLEYIYPYYNERFIDR